MASTACSSARRIWPRAWDTWATTRIPRCARSSPTRAAVRAPSARPIGILAPVEADARAFLEMGFQYVAVGSDIGVLKNATDALRAKFK